MSQKRQGRFGRGKFGRSQFGGPMIAVTFAERSDSDGEAGFSDYYAIGPDAVNDDESEERTFDSITISFTVDSTTLETVLRPLDSSSGKLEVVDEGEGSFRVIDRSDGDAEVFLRSPIKRRELRPSTTAYVDEYGISSEDRDREKFTVEVGFVFDEPRTGEDYSTADPSDDEWLFDFADGQIATDRVNGEINEGGSTVAGNLSIDTIMTHEEAIILEASLNRQTAVYTREVPDGEDLVVDNNNDERNTVSITAPPQRDPEEDVISSGDYVVEQFATDLINNQYVRVSMSITPT